MGMLFHHACIPSIHPDQFKQFAISELQNSLSWAPEQVVSFPILHQTGSCQVNVLDTFQRENNRYLHSN